MSTGVLLSIPSPSLASPIARSRLQCRLPTLAPVARGGPITAPADPLRLLGPALPITGMPSMMKKANKRLGGVTCYAAPLSPNTVQWVSAVSIAVLMLAKGTAIHKSFLLPLFALQAPPSVISWIKGDYGTWIAFVALLVRLFYYIPGQLELPFFTMLLVIVAPHQAMNLRDTQAGSMVSLAIAAYLAFQHFSRVGSVRSALDKSSIVATSAIILVTIIPCLFLL
ncbi:cold-regulated 413 inner membrane protein 1, chloroplastic-like [Curcuma longa]|uniref:cold-regulated 413 inner membrane protein 1, chloroplastic-like n=1 Tax=Curcuma longa TaxID=136217 RepID=UPI003D9EEB43